MSDRKFYVHEDGRCESENVGEGTRIWGRAHVLEGAVVGRDCNIGEGCFIEGGSELGDHVIVKNGVSVWEGVHVEDYVFLGPNCILTNDLWPRSKQRSNPLVHTYIRFGATIGAGAIIVCGNEIGRFAMVAAGALVTKPVEPFSLMVGSPARRVGWVCVCSEPMPRGIEENDEWSCPRCRRVYRFPRGKPKLTTPLKTPFCWHPDGAPLHKSFRS